MLSHEGSEPSLRTIPVCLEVPVPVGHHLVVAQPDKIHAAKACTLPGNRSKVLLPELGRAERGYRTPDGPACILRMNNWMSRNGAAAGDGQDTGILGFDRYNSR